MPDAVTAFEGLGWNERLATLAAAEDLPSARPGRVSRVDRGLVTVLCELGSVRAVPSVGPVATGDWVLVAPSESRDTDAQQVVAVLPRRSAFVRGDPMDGAARGEQVIAANIDTVFVVHVLDNGPNLRRLERELVLVYDSGAMPVIVLTKSDLAAETEDAVGSLRGIAPGIDVVVTSSVSGVGVDELHRFAGPQQTVALIGASGVGKSTLVNLLLREEVQDTGEVRAADQRGRHTTTAGELIALPDGGVLIDTPGLRAVSLWDSDAGFSRAFADIEALAEQCRFRDCAHRTEPGCAVRAAIARGDLDPERLEHYVRLDRELDATADRRRARTMSKAIRQFYKQR